LKCKLHENTNSKIQLKNKFLPVFGQISDPSSNSPKPHLLLSLKGSSIKDVHNPLHPSVRRCPHLTNPLSPTSPCGRPHSTLDTALWSGSVIAGAVGFRIWPVLQVVWYVATLPWEQEVCRPYSASPYYTLWHKSYKMNNNLQFILGITQRECLQNMLE